jgi:hypothetical protein
MDLLDREPAKPDTYFRITAEAVGPLTANTPLDAATIQRLLPSYSTETVLISQETATINATGVFAPSASGKIQILQIVAPPGGLIREIRGVGQHVSGPNGERPGMTLSETHADPATCRAGRLLWKDLIVCRSAAAANVMLTFALAADVSLNGRLPLRDVLQNAQLQQIIWQGKGAS